MKVIFEFERKEQYPLKEVIEKCDHTIPNPQEMIDRAFEQVQHEKAKRYINEILLALEKHNPEYKVVKILPKYLKEDVDTINFKIIFQIQVEYNNKKIKVSESTLWKDSLPGFQKFIEEYKPSKIWITP